MVWEGGRVRDEMGQFGELVFFESSRPHHRMNSMAENQNALKRVGMIGFH